MLNEGLKSWAIGKVTKASKEVGDVAGEEIRKKMHQAATEAAQAYTPAIKRGAKKLVLGVGGASLAGAGIGSYSGIKLATRKKRIKESILNEGVFKGGPIERMLKNLSPENRRLILSTSIMSGGAGIGAYAGAKVGKKRIKESNIVLFSFAVGMNSAFSKNRGGIPNCLVQEGVGDSLYKFFNLTKKVKPVKPFPASALGRAMYKDPKAMEQALRLYKGTKTLDRALPYAYGHMIKV